MSEHEWAQGVRDALKSAFDIYDREGGALSPLVVAALDAAGARIVPNAPTVRMACSAVETFGLRPSVNAMDKAISAAIAAAPRVQA